MRVIAGTLGGRQLQAPPGRGTRPTSDRVREALFSALAPDLVDAVVLDLYAGSGALGIEALSRGARRAVFVERDRRAAATVERNLAQLGLRAAVRRMAAGAYCKEPVGGPFSIVLMDPPYAEPIAEAYACLQALQSSGGLCAGARIVIERDRHEGAVQCPAPDWLVFDRSRSYGDTVLRFWRLAEDVR